MHSPEFSLFKSFLTPCPNPPVHNHNISHFFHTVSFIHAVFNCISNPAVLLLDTVSCKFNIFFFLWSLKQTFPQQCQKLSSVMYSKSVHLQFQWGLVLNYLRSGHFFRSTNLQQNGFFFLFLPKQSRYVLVFTSVYWDVGQWLINLFFWSIENVIGWVDRDMTMHQTITHLADTGSVWAIDILSCQGGWNKSQCLHYVDELSPFFRRPSSDDIQDHLRPHPWKPFLKGQVLKKNGKFNSSISLSAKRKVQSIKILSPSWF